MACLAWTRKMGLIKHIAAIKTSSACPASTLLLSASPLPTNPEHSRPSPAGLISNVRTRIFPSMADTILYPLKRPTISHTDGPPPHHGLRSSDLFPRRRGSPNLQPHCPSSLLPRRKDNYRDKDAQAHPRAYSPLHRLKCRC